MASATVADPKFKVFSINQRENAVVLVWKQQPTVEALPILRKAFEAAGSKSKICFLTVIEQNAISSSPDSQVRKDTAALLREYDDKIGAAAVIYEPSGLKATIIRSIISTINLASRASFPNAVLSSVAEACGWAETKLGNSSSLSARDLENLVNTARA